ncbi:MAG: hypothetical protein ACLFNZ_01295 [Spirochaetaceae bacterium]
MSKGGEKQNGESLLSRMRGFFSTMDQAHRSSVTELTEFQIRELENMFLLLLMGSFTGLPSPPSFISAELLPHLEHEIKVLNARAESASDSLAEVVGLLDID